jgi:hypothetical protein
MAFLALTCARGDGLMAHYDVSPNPSSSAANGIPCGVAILMGAQPLEDTALEVDLSDARSFRRSCIAWFGKPPSEVRQSYGQLRANARLTA